MKNIDFLRNYDFSGGLNDGTSNYIVQNNEAQAALNCRVDEQGILQKRRGVAAFGSMSSGWGGDFDGLHRCYCGETLDAGKQFEKALIGVVGTKLYYATDSTGAKTELDTGLTLTDGDRMRAIQWEYDRCYLAFAGGNTNAKCWALGTSTCTVEQRKLVNMGVKQITSAGTISVSGDAGTTTTGYYSYGVTLTYGVSAAWGESEVKRTATSVYHDDAAKKYSLASITDTSTWDTSEGAYKVRIYRSTNCSTEALADNAPLYYLTEVALGTTSLVYENSDHVIDPSTPAPSSADTGDVPSANIDLMCAHNCRMWVVPHDERDTAYYSNQNVPDEFPAKNRVWVHGKIMALVSAPFGLCFFTQNGIWLLRGWGIGDFSATLEELKGIQGCVASDSPAQIKMRGRQVVAYAAEDGIYGFDGQTSEFLGITHDGRGQKIAGAWNTYADSKENARGVTYKHTYRLAYQDSRDEGSYNNRVLVYDMRYDSWFIEDGMEVGAWARGEGPGDSDELWYGESDTDGYIYQADTGAPTSVEFLWQSRYYDIAGPEVSALLRKMWIEIERDSLPMNVQIDVDGSAIVDSFTIPALAAGATWQNVEWGGFVWAVTGTQTVSAERSLPTGLIGKRFAIKLYSTDDENKKIIGFSLGYRVKGRV